VRLRLLLSRRHGEAVAVFSSGRVSSGRVTPEILIVGDPAGRRQLADLIAALGYGVSLCPPRDLNRRVRTDAPPAAIVACMGDLDADVVLAGLRRTRAGASIPVILYGRLGGPLRDLADVLDLGADAFLEEPTGERHLRDALGQFVRPPEVHASSRGRESDERGRGPARRREEELPDRGRDARHDRGSERADPRPATGAMGRPRGEALGDLHRTLDRLEASLRSDDHRSDPELAALGFDDIPDVDPPDDPLVTDVGEHLRGRSRVDTGEPTPVRRDTPERPRPRPREPERPRRPEPDPSAETGSGRRSWREAGDEASSTRTRAWDRSEHEGSLRPRRERSEDPPARSGGRSSAVLLGRRPDRDVVRDGGRGESDSSEGTARFRDVPRELSSRPGDRAENSRDPLDPITMTERFDPHARDLPWPEEDFDPSESTMIRRERSSATARRRSWGDERREKPEERRDKPDERESTWIRSARESEPARPSGARGRPPARREPDRPRELEPTRELEPRRRVGRPAPITGAHAEPSLRIDPSLRETGKLGPDIDVATVLWALHDQRFTGKLRLVRARVEKQIWLHDGEAVFARSTATSDRLVDGLLRRGVLTRPQYETARRLAAKEPRRAGQLLVDAGFLKARELDVLLRDHLARVIDSTFEWTDGTWSTEPGDRTDEPTQLEVPMAALILDGIRYRCDASELEDRLTRRIGGRGPIVPRLRVKSEQGQLGGDDRAAIDELMESIGETFRLSSEEETWLRRFDGRHGVAALLADGADEQALFALLFTLDLAGCVDLREQPDPIIDPGGHDPARIDAERILERLRLAREADYFELLGVARDASRSEIRQAYMELGVTFSDDALEQNARRKHARELRELRAALEEARDILTDDAMRSAYLAHLGDGT
jgi:hypothetical protein